MNGQIRQYPSDDAVDVSLTVVIAPQDGQQAEAICLLLKDVEPHAYAGGQGCSVGHYFLRSYADIVCLEYRSIGFFTVAMEAIPVAKNESDW